MLFRGDSMVLEYENTLRSLLPGREIHWFRETDSTNTQLRKLALSGAKAGTVVLAESQTAGRGRMGRSFHSPAGCGLYFSLLLRPELPPESLGILPALAATAVRRGILHQTGLDTEIKWVNDLLAGGRKLCGILAEGVFLGGAMQHIIIGIGVNCSTAAEDFPAELRPIVTSISAETGQPVDRVALAASLLRELEQLPLASPADRLEEYRANCVTLGKQVTLPDGSTGTAVGLTEDYGLIVNKGDGQIVLRSGEATLHGQSSSSGIVYSP